jgi:hypothetical protein
VSNPIVEEVHRIREQMLAEYGGDLRALLKDARRRTEEAARGRASGLFARRSST